VVTSVSYDVCFVTHRYRVSDNVFRINHLPWIMNLKGASQWNRSPRVAVKRWHSRRLPSTRIGVYLCRRVNAVRPEYRVTCPVRNKDMHRAKRTRQDQKVLFLLDTRQHGGAGWMDAPVYWPILHKPFSHEDKNMKTSIYSHPVEEWSINCYLCVTNTPTAWNTRATSQTRDSRISCYNRASLVVLRCTNLHSQHSNTATVIMQIH
jgi:hypothetical protein